MRVALFRITYDGLPDLFRVLARATAAGLLVYLVVEPPSFTVANQTYAYLFGFVEIGRWHNDQGGVSNAEMRVGQTEIWLDGSGKRKDNDERDSQVWIVLKIHLIRDMNIPRFS